jgi:hypothetical protein
VAGCCECSEEPSGSCAMEFSPKIYMKGLSKTMVNVTTLQDEI